MNRDEIQKFVLELRDFQKELERKQLSMFKKLVEHLEYHKKNEARWGLVKILRDHPFRTIAIAFLIGMVLAGLLAPDIKEWAAIILGIVK